MSKKLIFTISAILLVISFFFNLSFGGSGLGLVDIFKYLINPDSVENNENFKTIIFQVRLPRTLVALVVGACLSASGVLIQAVMKNPLADSGILGIQSGATVVALIIMLVFPSLHHFLPIASFAGGIIVFLILMSVSVKSGLSPIRLILSGVAINALLGAVIGLITIFNSDKIQDALSWLNGSFANVGVAEAKTIVIYGSIALIITLFLIKKCNLLLLDDTTIITLGVNITLLRFVVATFSVLLASISVSIVGIIGFVGLVIPHIGRMIVGKKHEYLIPFSLMSGATLTLFADGLQKLVFNPIEIPAGIIISFIGASFFFYLLIRGTKI